MLAVTAASAADIKIVPDGSGRSVISLTGDIVVGDAAKLEPLLQFSRLYSGSMLAATRTVQFVGFPGCVEACVYRSMDQMIREILRRAGVS